MISILMTTYETLLWISDETWIPYSNITHLISAYRISRVNSSCNTSTQKERKSVCIKSYLYLYNNLIASFVSHMHSHLMDHTYRIMWHKFSEANQWSFHVVESQPIIDLLFCVQRLIREVWLFTTHHYSYVLGMSQIRFFMLHVM